MWKSILRLVEVVFRLLPINRQRVFFVSFRGQYNDNPKYISEELHRRDCGAEIVWAISDGRCRERLPDYIKAVTPDTLRSVYYKSTSGVIVDNGAGYHNVMKSAPLGPMYNMLKKPGQFNLSTWHGTPLKRIGLDMVENQNVKTIFSTSDALIAGCEYTRSILLKAFGGKTPVLLTGTPRNDLLFRQDHGAKESIKLKLGLPADRRVVLYAPTYRDDPAWSGIEQMKRIDVEALLTCLGCRFGDKWVFAIRVHQMALEEIDTALFAARYPGRVYNGNQFDDMAEYLAASDALITDYSGALFDFALTRKPCFLFAPDLKQYRDVERGLYLDVSDLPFVLSTSFEELVNSIETHDVDQQNAKIQSFLADIGNVEDGSASKRVVDMIIEELARQ